MSEDHIYEASYTAGAPAPDSESDPTPGDALLAEVDAEHNFPDGTVTVTLADTEVRILPPDEWTSGAQRALTDSRFDEWAEECLAGDDYDRWADLNNGRGPKLRDIQAMFEQWAEVTGQSRGKSHRVRMSSRGGRRR